MKTYTSLTLMLWCASFTGFVSAEANFNVDSDLLVQSSSRIQSNINNNWYLASNNTEQNSTNAFYGGYQRQLIKDLDLFVEAGMLHDHDDIATQQGFDMATGVSYHPTQTWLLKSRVSRIRPSENMTFQYDFELSSSYDLMESISIKASYQLRDPQLDSSTMEHSLQLGLGYRF